MSKSIDIQLVTKENVWNRTEEEKNSSLKSKQNLIRKMWKKEFVCEIDFWKFRKSNTAIFTNF